MANYNVVVGVKDQVFPAGTVAGDWVFAISGDATSVVQKADASPTTFDLNPGSYVATVSRLDAAGVALVSVSKSFTVDIPTQVIVSVPDTVDVVAA